jgi:hypothetical protein
MNMSAAEQLLNSLTEDIPTHDHTVEDTDTYFVIDPDTREITNPVRRQYIMQGDHNSEIYTFELPRYIDSHDMTLCNQVKVHYINISEDELTQYADVADASPLQTKEDDENTVICTWKIDRKATQLVGNLSFGLEYQCVTDEGEVVYEWNTDIYSDVEVKDSLDHGAQVAADYSDILEQWRAKLFGAGDSVMENINDLADEQIASIIAKGESQVESVNTTAENQIAAVNDKGNETLDAIQLKTDEALASIPEDYTTVSNMADEALRTKANAIKLSSEGEVIVINDSADSLLMGMNVYGKTTQKTTTGAQLFNPYAEQNNSFGNAVVEDDGAKITVTGSYYVSWPITLKAGVQYYIDFTVSGDTEYRAVRFEYPDKEITDIITNPASFTPTKDTVSVYLYAGLGTEGAVTYRNVQISEGSSAKLWEPYTGGAASPIPDYPQELESVENPEVIICGANLFDDSALIGQTVSSIHGNMVVHLVPGKYFASVSISGDISEKEATLVFYNSDKERIVEVNTLKNAVFEISETVDSVNIYPFSGAIGGTWASVMIRAAEYEGLYEPYKPVQSMTIPRSIPGIQVSKDGNYTDSNGQQWICDEIDFERGVYVQRIGHYIYDGSEDEVWNGIYTYGETGAHYVSTPITRGISQYQTPMICNRGTYRAWSGNLICFINGYKDFVLGGHAIESALTDKDTFRAHLADHPFEIAYVLETPIETPLTAEELLAYTPLRTNYYNTTVLNDSNAYMKIKYNADTLIYLRDHQPKPTDTQVSTAVNEYLDANGVQIPSDEHIIGLIDAEVDALMNKLV